MISAFDRYFLIIALTNIVMALVGVSALYVLIDYLYNVETLGSYPIADVIEYYYHNVPPVIFLLGPMVTLMGASFGISRILKNREILPLATGGLRSFRSFRMFWVAALITALGLLAARVWILPQVEFSAQQSQVANLRKAKGQAVSLRDDLGNFWHIQKFDLIEGSLEEVTIVRYGEDGLPAEYISADSLSFEDGEWLGQQRIIVVSNIEQQERLNISYQRDGKVEGVSLAPNSVATRGIKRTYRSPSELRALIAESPHRADLMVDYYKILAWPFLTLALVLAGAVIALRLDVRNIFLAVALTIVLAFAVFALVFVLEKMAKKGSVSPEVGVLLTPIALLILAIGGLRWFAD